MFPNPLNPLLNGPTLPEICLDVRQSINGSADPLTRDSLEGVRAMLAATVAAWDKQRDDVIDECINRMCRAAITLIDDELERRVRDGFTY